MEKYIGEYNSVLDNYFNEEDSINMELEKLKEQKKVDKITDSVLAEKKKELRNTMNIASMNATSKLTEVKKNMLNEYQESQKPSGAKLDMEEVALLNSGINFTAEEINYKYDKFKGNSTMQRLYSDYAINKELRVYFPSPKDQEEEIISLLDRSIQAVGFLGNAKEKRILNSESRKSFIDSAFR